VKSAVRQPGVRPGHYLPVGLSITIIAYIVEPARLPVRPMHITAGWGHLRCTPRRSRLPSDSQALPMQNGSV